MQVRFIHACENNTYYGLLMSRDIPKLFRNTCSLLTIVVVVAAVVVKIVTSQGLYRM
jgi:hypothetical protein